MDIATNLESRLTQLRQRYTSSLPERLASIGETLEDCEHGVQDSGTRLNRQFHTLAGTAGTYGLLTIATMAAEGELACERLVGDTIEPLDARYLRYLLDELSVTVACGQNSGQAVEAVFPTNSHPISAESGGRFV